MYAGDIPIPQTEINSEKLNADISTNTRCITKYSEANNLYINLTKMNYILFQTKQTWHKFKCSYIK